MKNLEVLKEVKDNETYEKYFDAFHLISKNNFNILREIRLPKWADKNLSYVDIVE